ncbi:hypothetical protein [Asanoa siamensis]|uniref:Ceramidase n=1 Tax=Asanoa siamensis TaxID=926357 RepID=A0ABQ4CJ54_9ACTN|nr:hypothetical protein [Asanoa siamensis]GIF71293.1 hypothetical protein Asi02nite_08110 [Asanoa siamensis]
MDGYCERLGPGLWAEPLNAVSNVAFLIASAALLTLLARRPSVPPPSLGSWALPALLGVVGLCSLVFHTFATPWTAALDSLSILVYVLVGVVLLVRRGWGIRPSRAWLAAPAFVLFAAVVNGALAAVDPSFTVGGYLPALLGLAAFAAALRSHLLTAAAAVFAASLTLRTLDEPLCAHLPSGTHWLWHVLNAAVLTLIALHVDRAPISPNQRTPLNA